MRIINETTKIELVPIDRLTPHPRNPRQGDIGAIHESILANGFYGAVVAQRRTGYILAGNHRYEAAKHAGAAELPVIWLDVDDATALRILLVDNRTNDLAAYDNATLAELLQEILSDAGTLDGTGYDGDALDELLADLGLNGAADGADDEGVDELIDRAEELREKWDTEDGQLWEIPSKAAPDRSHRLLCGDATSAAAVKRLLEGAKPSLMVTDPPYGVEYDPHWRAREGINKSRRKMGKVDNDDRIDWREAWSLFSGAVAYVWHAATNASDVQSSLRAARFEARSQIIWRKDQFAFSRGHYHWQHEPCWYAVRKGCRADWIGDRTQSTMWEIPTREDGGHGHGTQKPTECMQRPIRNHEGDVYDPFVGSGTTIVAAENERRVCHAMEIDPKYVAVTLERLAGRGLEPQRVIELE